MCPAMSGYLIPPPADPRLRAEWAAGVAARQRAGLSVLVGEDYLTDGPPAPAGKTLRYLDRTDIGRWFDVSGDAVRKWQERYREGGDYRPFPAPDVILGGTPGWSPHREAEIYAWHAGKPGRGAGGGRPRKRQAE